MMVPHKYSVSMCKFKVPEESLEQATGRGAKVHSGISPYGGAAACGTPEHGRVSLRGDFISMGQV